VLGKEWRVETSTGNLQEVASGVEREQVWRMRTAVSKAAVRCGAGGSRLAHNQSTSQVYKACS
jgi:hypothetical protein